MYVCVYARVCSIACESMHVCVCACVCVCVCVCVAGSIPDDYGHTRLSSLSQTQVPDFSFILLGGYQQPVHAGVCGVMCVRGKKMKRPKIGIHWPEKSLQIAVWCRPG